MDCSVARFGPPEGIRYTLLHPSLALLPESCLGEKWAGKVGGVGIGSVRKQDPRIP